MELSLTFAHRVTSQKKDQTFESADPDQSCSGDQSCLGAAGAGTLPVIRVRVTLDASVRGKQVIDSISNCGLFARDAVQYMKTSIATYILFTYSNTIRQIQDMADRSNFSSDGYGPSKPSEEGDYLASCSYQPCIYQPPIDDYQSWHSFYLMQQSSQAQNEEYASLRPITGQMQQSQAPNTMAPYPSAESLYMQNAYSQPQYSSAGGIVSPYGAQSLGGLSGVDNAGNMISPYDPQPSFDTHLPNVSSYVPNPVSYGDAPSNVATSLNAATPSDWQQSQFTAPMQDLSAMQSLLAITDSSTPSMLPQSDRSANTVALQSTPMKYMELEDWWSFRQMNRHINTKAPDGHMCFACKKRFGHFQVLVTMRRSIGEEFGDRCST